jgi:hypothetical protein
MSGEDPVGDAQRAFGMDLAALIAHLNTTLIPIHNVATGRDAADAHPISAITGLSAALADKAPLTHAHAWADITSGKPATYPSDWNILNNKPLSFPPSAHAHDYIPTSASCNKNWNWSGQGGQPPWVWGGSAATDMYVYNPSNFNVDMVDGVHASALAGTSSASSWDLQTAITNPLSNGGSWSPKSGMYRLSDAGNIGLPGGWWHILQMKHAADGYDAQLGIEYYGGSNIAFRSADAQSWGPWHTIFNTGNSAWQGVDQAAYIRFPNGLQICYGYWTGTCAVTTAWGSGFDMASPISLGNFPVAFAATPTVVYMFNSGDSAYLGYIGGQALPTTTAWGSFNILRMTSATITNARISAIAFGRWF